MYIPTSLSRQHVYFNPSQDPEVLYHAAQSANAQLQKLRTEVGQGVELRGIRWLHRSRTSRIVERLSSQSSHAETSYGHYDAVPAGACPFAVFFLVSDNAIFHFVFITLAHYTPVGYDCEQIGCADYSRLLPHVTLDHGVRSSFMCSCARNCVLYEGIDVFSWDTVSPLKDEDEAGSTYSIR